MLAVQNEQDAAERGVNAEEYKVLLDRLGRAPNRVELGVIGEMWSEHCSYKSSRMHLAKFPTKGARVIQGPGENAGVVDIDDGQACIFKMESHNHPSFIEPYQGAATGVGGILRDVFTMGARPVALVNALRFGETSHPKTRGLVSGVVAGIGGYGNCVGVPTVAGETQFHKGYNGNILVNAMAVGLADQDKIFYAKGAVPGRSVMYVGAKTGRDGIGGASMSSAEFAEGDEEKRPTVQVGAPFTEKLLIEACLELMATDAIESIQDMGAAGLTSSAVEIADKGGIGIEMDLDAVPQREYGMTAFEIMLSESQERMLMILKPGREDVAKAIFDKWDLDAEVIGVTTDTKRFVLKQFGEVVCDIPVPPLAEDAPKYDLPWNAPSAAPDVPRSEIPTPTDFAATLKTMLSLPNMASKRWIWEQYDRHVMGDTLDSSQSGGDAALVRVHGTSKALAICSDCNPQYVAADPFEGGKQAVAEAYRNLSSVGAEPIAITNNLNFGSPNKPDTMGYIVKAIEGMAEACKELDFPVVSGNVSLNNQTDGVAIPPTPVCGGIGLVKDIEYTTTASSARLGDVLMLVGDIGTHLNASLYLREVVGREEGPPPPVDLATEKRRGEFVRSLIKGKLVTACHDVSDGGLACAAAEMGIGSGVGVALNNAMLDDDADLLAHYFGEDQGRYLLAISPGNVSDVMTQALDANIPLIPIGQFAGESIQLGDQSITLADLRAAYEGWMPEYMASVN
ncbi:phosphoribosylformylglycinamidine synthase subunit PurL [Hirschia litorea]|uniref:Phosphoribosylformylglycinamidine synthase subunit PurL n=1 Tax=Hirschia litorea TaxID=1199156 RepID=A0ABW2ILN2_9PROT